MNRRQLMLAGMAAFMSRYLPTSRAADADPQTVAKACNQFAFDFYAKTRGDAGNLFLSPFSIATAFGMTSLGARGQTLDQMLAAFHLGDDEAVTHGGFGKLIDQFNGAGQDPKKRGYALSVANALWGQKDYPWQKPFLASAEKYYHAGLREVDFIRDTEAARKTINTWVEAQTNDKIKELLKSGILTVDTRLVLTNAIYFKGDWATQFKPAATKEESFHVTDDKTTKAPLMNRSGDYPYFESADVQALELPYKGKELGMLVLLPTKRDGLGDLEKSLNADKLGEIVKGLREQKNIQLTIPKFKIEKELSLDDGLKALGLKDAFIRGTADFSGLNGEKKDLYISAAVHKAFVEVNEEGTEAAAATAVVVATVSAPITPVFRADRPFLFLIRDLKTGVVLFMGRLVNPSA